eukprot:NODE_2981_length_1053_cov_25.490281_g2843_i0.p1 GENE.NODE_2981_length_1053_cov_25.490281_g2843_i0~~NODE_2981_length_1053_cov_25.490281_g2843_i0.p1  ORF type:complete len:300 (-),score=55.69 NODE_2981_length_1053_cov_25.490281_g2843_i0:96-995(-)
MLSIDPWFAEWEGGPDCPVKLYNHTLPPVLYTTLHSEIRHMISSSDNYTDDGDAMSLSFGTYWCPLDLQPRNTIEQAVQYLHQRLPLPANIVGAEWWWQAPTLMEAPKEYHTDKDVRLSQPPTHPLLSSVFYFGTVGGPTVVFGQSTDGVGGLYPALPHTVVLSWPQPNQYLLFHGHLYHGVAHPGAGAGKSTPANQELERHTFLINWWTHHPSCASELPLHLYSSITPPSHRHTPTKTPLPVHRLLHTFERHLNEWREQRCEASLPRRSALLRYLPHSLALTGLEWSVDDLNDVLVTG